MKSEYEELSRAYKAKQLRYKRSALASLGWDNIRTELWEISSACDEVQYYFEDENDSLVAAMDGDEDEAWEFKMAFSDLSAKCEILEDIIRECDRDNIGEYYDECTVALIGNRYKSVGYDSYEEDYYALCGFEQELAQTEAGKKVCRWTKSEMVAKIGQCFGILLSYYDLRHHYDYLKSTMDILRGDNLSILKTVKSIEAAYDRMSDGWGEDKEFNYLLSTLPDRVWIE